MVEHPTETECSIALPVTRKAGLVSALPRHCVAQPDEASFTTGLVLPADGGKWAV